MRCHADTSSDVENCGSCNTVCPVPPNSTPDCRTGVCGYTCLAGWADCDGDAANGCEVHLVGDVANCGACGHACAALANAKPTCAQQACSFVCDSGFANCDGNVSNGCETDLGTVANCGACGNACKAPNATAVCSGGACALGACDAGFSDCDQSAADGCEVHTSADWRSCGACGSVCPVGQRCASGTCTPGLEVLLLGDSYAPDTQDVQARLKSLGTFSTIDINTTSPVTLQALQPYDAVLVWRDSYSNDGDVLADYFDAGGTVVVATGSGKLYGRFATQYLLIAQTTSSTCGSCTLGTVLDPSSPLLSNVSSLSSPTVLFYQGMLLNNATAVALWSNQIPLVVRGVVNGRNRVDLNVYPVSSAADATYGWSGAGAALIRNALLYR
jgi:hypothetical protein